MNINDYFKKVYTIAFRLTGDEMKADYMAFIAIKSTLLDLNLPNKISINMLQCAAKEVCRIFLSESNDIQILKSLEQENNKPESFQNALMTLNPLSRVIIIWKDVLGFKIDDMTEINRSKQEMYSVLHNARSQMKEILKDIAINEIGA